MELLIANRFEARRSNLREKHLHRGFRLVVRPHRIEVVLFLVRDPIHGGELVSDFIHGLASHRPLFRRRFVDAAKSLPGAAAPATVVGTAVILGRQYFQKRRRLLDTFLLYERCSDPTWAGIGPRRHLSIHELTISSRPT